MIQKYSDKFEDHMKLAKAMKIEWETKFSPKQKEFRDDQQEDRSGNKQRRHKIEEEKQITFLRKHIGHWIEECWRQKRDEVEQNIKILGDIRTIYQKIDHYWQKEVLYQRDVQNAIIDAAKFMINSKTAQSLANEAVPSQKILTSDYHNRSQKLSSLLRHILHPIDRIKENKFPSLRLVTESIKEVDGIYLTKPFEITSIQQLPDEWRKYKKFMNLEKESPNLLVRSAQQKLESTIKYQEQIPVKTYEYLIFLGVLQIFGFDVSTFKFRCQLSKRNIDNILELYEAHVSKFNRLKGVKEKQAYVFQVGLYNIENKETAVQYMFRSIAERLHHYFRGIYGPDDSINMSALKTKLQDSLPKDLCSDSKSFFYAFESQFRFLWPFKKEQVKHHCQDRISTTIATDDLCPREVEIMEALDMKKYYPGKLTYDKVITLTSDVNDDINKKPTSLPELPWYFIRHVIGLDSETREECCITTAQQYNNKDSDTDSDSDDDDQGIINGVHPLDLEKIIMMCADDFLRQELMDKMIRCQYAVPFIVPTSHDLNLILLWALESVMRSFYHNGQDATKPLVDIKTPLVTFMNVGEETSWKSRLLNKMLSS